MPVLLSVEGPVSTLVLDEPETRNAITSPEMLEGIITAIEDAPAETLVLIITGAGAAFSAGGNIKDMAARRGLFAGTTSEIMEGYRRSIQRMTRAILETDLATIAAVNGPAVGAGFDLALGCDLRLGSTGARFAHTFVDLGIIPGDGGAWLLPRVVGWQRAAELSFTARMVGAEEAKEMGILLEVVAPEALVPRATELAGLIASKPAHSIRLAKRLLRQARTMDLSGFLDFSAALQAISHNTEAHREAVGRLQRNAYGNATRED